MGVLIDYLGSRIIQKRICRLALSLASHAWKRQQHTRDNADCLIQGRVTKVRFWPLPENVQPRCRLCAAVGWMVLLLSLVVVPSQASELLPLDGLIGFGNGDPVPAGGFGLVQRMVGSPYQRLRRGAVAGVGGQPD